MKLPLDLRFIGMAPSPALEADVHERVAHVDRFCPDVMAWRVTIEQEARHQHQGRPYAVRIDITLPGQEVAVNRVQDADAHVALRNAFDAARRQLEDAVRIRRGQVKQHALPPAPGSEGEAA